jgi:spore germination cell wall hydrolase CwlJ-like protein
MKIFEQLEGFPLLKWAEGFVIGLMVVVAINAFNPHIVKVPEIRIVEKPVIVKTPVYLNKNDQRQIQCLARNAYFEARNQSETGMVAVTNVVMNRASDSRFPDTPCEVVYQKVKGVCQFSWVCEGKKTIRNANLYKKTVEVAENVYLGNYKDVTSGSKFYHADYVNPDWGFRRITQIGAHIFYRG